MMKNFIFDVFGTLIDMETDTASEEAWRGVSVYFREKGIEIFPQELHQSYKNIREGIKNRLKAEYGGRPEVNRIDVFCNLAQEMGVQFTREEGLSAYRMMRRGSTVRFKPFDGIFELLEELKLRGVKLYYLSNAQAEIAREELQSAGLAEYFDGGLISSECGYCKPDFRIFKALFEKFELNCEDCILIGDSNKNDIKGAKRAKIKAIWAPNGAPSMTAEILDLV